MNVVFVTKCYLLWFILLLSCEIFKPVQFANTVSRDCVVKCRAMKHYDCHREDCRNSAIINIGYEKSSLILFSVRKEEVGLILIYVH